MLDRQTEVEVSLGLRQLLPALPHRPVRIDRNGLAAGQEPPTGPAHGCPAEDPQEPQQDLPRFFQLLLQPVVERGCQQEAAVLPFVFAPANDVTGVADPACPSQVPVVSLDDYILKIVETGIRTARDVDEGAMVLIRISRPADDDAVVVDPEPLAGDVAGHGAMAEQ